MAAKETEAVQRAVVAYQAGASLSAAARAENLHPSSLHRALARRGIERRGPPSGPAHHAYIDGRTEARRRERDQRAGEATPAIKGCALV